MYRRNTLYDRYMEYAEKFELEYRNAKNGAAYDLAEFPKRYVAAPGRRFSAPDWSTLFTYHPPAMEENAYVEAIQKQAYADKQMGRIGNTKAYHTLLNSFLQCASPDRIAIYQDSMRHTGGRMNATFKFFDEYGHTVLRWNPTFDGWECTLTSLEKARMEIFKEIYHAACGAVQKRR